MTARDSRAARLVLRALEAGVWVVVLWTDLSAAFTPARAELPPGATGFSRGLLNFIVLHASAPFPRIAGSSAIVATTVGLVVMAATLRGRASRWYWWTAELAGAAFLGLVVIAPYVTPFRIVLMPRTFVLMSLLVCSASLPSLAESGQRVGARMAPRLPMVAGLVAAAFFASAAWHGLALYSGNYSGFFHMSRRVADRAPMLQESPELRQSILTGDEGYDGQFMYLMAFDPLLERYKDRPQVYGSFIDLPPYRYGRIGFSALVAAVSAGRAERFPRVMIWLLIAAHAVLAAGLAALALAARRSPWLGLWYLAIPAFMTSFLFALPEVLAAAAVVTGLVCWRTRRDVWAVAAFGAALLVRETSAVLLIALVVSSGVEWRRAVRVAAVAVLPLAAWRLFVGLRLYPEIGSRAGFGTQYSFGVPFAGWLDLWRAALSHVQPAPEIAGALVFPWIVTAAAAIVIWALFARRGTFELAAAAYAAMAVSLNYVNVLRHLPSGERVTFELFLSLLLLMITRPEESRTLGRALKGLFLVLTAYTLLLAPDAWMSRAATGLIR